jgi:hypothetical protein
MKVIFWVKDPYNSGKMDVDPGQNPFGVRHEEIFSRRVKNSWGTTWETKVIFLIKDPYNSGKRMRP